jgi:hypothetical protein
MAAPTVYEVPQGQCIFEISNDLAGTLEVWQEIHFKTMTYTDDSTAVDVTTTKHRTGGIQYLASLVTAQGITIEIEGLRLITGTGSLDLQDGMQAIWTAWKLGGKNRTKNFRIELPEDADSSDYIAFAGTIESCQPLGGGVTDASNFRVRIKSYGAITETRAA